MALVEIRREWKQNSCFVNRIIGKYSLFGLNELGNHTYLGLYGYRSNVSVVSLREKIYATLKWIECRSSYDDSSCSFWFAHPCLHLHDTNTKTNTHNHASILLCTICVMRICCGMSMTYLLKTARLADESSRMNDKLRIEFDPLRLLKIKNNSRRRGRQVYFARSPNKD